MANGLKIKRGDGTPAAGADGSNGVWPYELAWDYTNNKLWINDNGTMREVTSANTFAASAITSGELATARVNWDSTDKTVRWDNGRGYHGNPRSMAIGYSGGNYGQFGYAIDFTTTSGQHTYAFNDIASRCDLYDGLQVYTSVTGGSAGSAISWTELLRVRNGAFNYKGHQIWHANNDGGGSGLDADTVDGIQASSFFRTDATSGTITSQDWNTYIDGTEVSFNQVNNHSGSNRPSGAYSYGLALSYATGSSYAKFQLYAPEKATAGSSTNEGLWYRTGWSSTYRQWAQILDSTLTGFTTAANFTAGSINTTGDSQFGNRIAMDGTSPFLRIQESGVTNNPEWWVGGDGGNFSIRLNNSGAYPLAFNTNAANNVIESFSMGYGGTISGSLTVAGSVMISNNSFFVAEDADGDDINILGIHSNNNCYVGPSTNAWAGGAMLYGAASGTNAHVWYEGDAERMRIADNGSLGIGTNSPGAKLQIGSGTDGKLFYTDGLYNDVTFSGGSGGTNGVWEFVNSGTWDQTRLYVQDANNVAARLTFDFRGNGTSNKILAGTSTGKVGINNTAPDTLLHIKNSGSGGTSTLKLEDNAREMYLGRDAIGVTTLDGSTAAQLYINSNVTFSGSVTGISTLSASSSLTTGYGVAFTNGATNFLIYNNTNDNLIYLRDTTNGQMLQTWTPTSISIQKPLTVTGNITSTASLVLPGSHSASKIHMYSGGHEKIGTEHNTLLFTADNYKFKDVGGANNFTMDSSGIPYFEQGAIVGGFGARSTGGTTDWNHSTNARSGNGFSLLLSTATNGPGAVAVNSTNTNYFHTLSFEYSSYDNDGNMTQIGIPYYYANNDGVRPVIRSRYSGSWSAYNSLVTANANGQIQGNAGTDALPSYSFNGGGNTDLDTGMLNPGANVLAFATAGARRYQIDASGNHAIYGNTSFSSPMSVNYGVTINEGGHDSDTRIESDGNANMFRVDASTNRIGIGTGSPGSLLTVYKDGTQVSNPSATYQIMTVSASNGGMAIQAGASSDAIIALGDQGQYDAGRIRYHNDLHHMDFCTGGNNPRMTIQDDGHIAITNTKRLILDGVDGNTYINQNSGSSSRLDFTVNGTGVMDLYNTFLRINGYIEPTGNLYIRHGGSDYSPRIEFLGGSNTSGSNAHENSGIGYYDNSGTGTMLFFGNRGAMNWTFKDDGDTLFHMDSGGTFHADADVVAYSSTTSSDKRLKENIKPIPYGLKEVLQMNPVEYDWKEKRNKAHDIGVIAQEIEKIIPEVVQENKDLNSDETFKGVDYGKMVAVLIKAVQEQQVQIDELKTKLGE